MGNIRFYTALAFRCFRRLLRLTGEIITFVRMRMMFFINNIDSNNIRSNGMPYICVSPSGKCIIGKNFSMNNGMRFNPIGYPQPCTIYVNSGAKLKIGNNVGISQASIICHHYIIIEDNVKIGGGVKIYDTDFHSINPMDRLNHNTDMRNKKNAPVVLRENCFIGAGSIVLKGVTIGVNSVVGAGSVVTKSIPDNEIWAGNPARFIKKI